jgi:anaphase-promoting complex subunit 4
MAEAEDDGGGGADGDVLSFTLHLDKSLSCAVKIAAWNPEKDLLAMVTQDHQLLVHRFNWQRLWAVSPDQRVTAICWRPDGKALAVGHHDGSIAIRDVENGDVLRQTATHNATVECLYWTEEGHHFPGQLDDVFSYEDRTPRFFPSPPRAPPMPGTAPTFDMSGVLGPGAEDQGSANQKTILLAVQQRLYVLCSGDKDGTICLSAFGVFPIGKLNIRERAISCMRSTSKSEMNPVYRLLNASALQVFLSNSLRNMTVICSGTLSMEGSPMVAGAAKRSPGLYAISVDTSLLGDRRKELRQVALQASSVVELLDVVQATLNVMHKQWHEAISVFEEKFQPLSVLLMEHGTCH